MKQKAILLLTKSMIRAKLRGDRASEKKWRDAITALIDLNDRQIGDTSYNLD
jgi:hypothetical protein